MGFAVAVYSYTANCSTVQKMSSLLSLLLYSNVQCVYHVYLFSAYDPSLFDMRFTLYIYGLIGYRRSYIRIVLYRVKLYAICIPIPIHDIYNGFIVHAFINSRWSKAWTIISVISVRRTVVLLPVDWRLVSPGISFKGNPAGSQYTMPPPSRWNSWTFWCSFLHSHEDSGTEVKSCLILTSVWCLGGLQLSTLRPEAAPRPHAPKG